MSKENKLVDAEKKLVVARGAWGGESLKWMKGVKKVQTSSHEIFYER